MLAKWYYSVLIVGIAFFGAISQQQNIVPNQEIILSFSQEQISSQDTQDVIVILKTQLQSLGAENIQVYAGDNGNLKIAYYSDENVNHVKQSLSKSYNIEDANTECNSNKSSSENSKNNESIVFDLDVYEIQNIENSNGLGGKYALETTSKNDYTFNPNLYPLNKHEDNRAPEINEKLVSKVRVKSSTVLDNAFRKKIPEVRAGPRNRKDS